MEKKTITLGDFFTADDLKRACKLADAREIRDQVVIPRIAHINGLTGQENDPMFFAYLVQYALMTYKGKE